MSELLNDLTRELSDLQSNATKLFEFMHGKEYAELPAVHQGLLMVQYRFMEGYVEALRDRIQLIEDEEK